MPMKEINGSVQFDDFFTLLFQISLFEISQYGPGGAKRCRLNK